MLLRTAAERVRRAISASDYEAAVCLLEDFRKVAEDAWRAAESEDQRQQVSSDVQELLQWAQETMLAVRAHQKGKLLQFTRARVYLGGDEDKPDQLALDA